MIHLLFDRLYFCYQLIINRNFLQDMKNANHIITTTEMTNTQSNSMSRATFITLLLLNLFNSAFLFGVVPAVSSYALLPYGQKAFYYTSVIAPIAYPLVALISFRVPTVPKIFIVIGSIIGYILCTFIMATAWQSPCPWWADTTHGAAIVSGTVYLATVIIAYVRLAIGNTIKREWPDDKGLFLFGISVQFGMLLGSVPIFLIIDVFGLLVDRAPCKTYCLE